jgi:hypothetical protein
LLWGEPGLLLVFGVGLGLGVGLLLWGEADHRLVLGVGLLLWSGMVLIVGRIVWVFTSREAVPLQGDVVASWEVSLSAADQRRISEAVRRCDDLGERGVARVVHGIWVERPASRG